MWIPAFQTCAVRNSDEIKPALITTLITDIILFVTMLVGLFRLFIDNNCAFGVGRLLWKQVESAFSLPPFPQAIDVLFNS